MSFISWSDGGTAQHNVTVGDSDVSFTARLSTSGPAYANGERHELKVEHFEGIGWARARFTWSIVAATTADLLARRR